MRNVAECTDDELWESIEGVAGEFIFDRPGRCDMHRDLDKMDDEHSGDCPLGA